MLRFAALHFASLPERLTIFAPGNARLLCSGTGGFALPCLYINRVSGEPHYSFREQRYVDMEQGITVHTATPATVLTFAKIPQ